MYDPLSTLDLLLLKEAKAVYSSFSVTGYLLGVFPYEDICFGRVYGHVRADSHTGRFADGHLMHTSTVMKVYERNQVVAVSTLNSLYVCVTLHFERAIFFSHFDALSKPLTH